MWPFNGFVPNTKKGVTRLNRTKSSRWLVIILLRENADFMCIVIARVRNVSSHSTILWQLKGDSFSKRREFSQSWIAWFFAQFGFRFHKRLVPWAFRSKKQVSSPSKQLKKKTDVNGLPWNVLALLDSVCVACFRFAASSTRGFDGQFSTLL